MVSSLLDIGYFQYYIFTQRKNQKRQDSSIQYLKSIVQDQDDRVIMHPVLFLFRDGPRTTDNGHLHLQRVTRKRAMGERATGKRATKPDIGPDQFGSAPRRRLRGQRSCSPAARRPNRRGRCPARQWRSCRVPGGYLSEGSGGAVRE